MILYLILRISTEDKNGINFGFWVKVLFARVIWAAHVVSALRKKWNICDDIEFMDLEDGVFWVKFKSEFDAKKVEDNNLWCFNGSLVTLQQ